VPEICRSSGGDCHKYFLSREALQPRDPLHPYPKHRSTLKMDTVVSPEALVNFYQNTRCHIPEYTIFLSNLIFKQSSR